MYQKLEIVSIKSLKLYKILKIDSVPKNDQIIFIKIIYIYNVDT